MRTLQFTVAGAILFAGSAIGGRALAAFRTEARGGGTATVQTLSIELVAVSADIISSSSFVAPGHPGDLLVSVHNQNSFDVNVLSIEPTGDAITVDPDHANAGCRATDVSGHSVAPAPSVALRRGATASYRAPGALVMVDGAANECQGAKFAVPVRVTVRKLSI